jgi:hypothetical protein
MCVCVCVCVYVPECNGCKSEKHYFWLVKCNVFLYYWIHFMIIEVKLLKVFRKLIFVFAADVNLAAL